MISFSFCGSIWRFFWELGFNRASEAFILRKIKSFALGTCNLPV